MQKDKSFDKAAYYCLTLGLIGTVTAEITGAMDLGSISSAARGYRVAVIHMALGLFVLVPFGLAFYLRRKDEDVLDGRKGWLYLICLGVGVAVLAITGWYGGELVYRYGLPYFWRLLP